LLKIIKWKGLLLNIHKSNGVCSWGLVSFEIKDTSDKSGKTNTQLQKCTKDEIKRPVEKGFSVKEALELCNDKK
jgi:hypothetical protein